ncbi:BAHD acyltransferase [Prunus yedoensis var. nudiflora]|uniref:BAHD acyltransferase n=1 Tax=Prunus yedoensis var. nudiflora TaxID=2094558 RepID=A0A314UZW7_PRUYE|nr:BAHD acyltransferase [Prunus yedoensis var. nudiflora]
MPTRVEVVSAIIWKCARDASRLNLGSMRPSPWCQTVNMRKIFVSGPLGDEDLLGNFVGLVAAQTKECEADHDDLQNLVTKLRKGLEEFKERYSNGSNGDDFCEDFMENVNLMKGDDIDSYTCSSWCRFPLL